MFFFLACFDAESISSKFIFYFSCVAEPKKLFSYSTLIPEVQGQISAAHHQSCPVTKELFNIVMSMGRTTTIKVISIDSNGHGTGYGEVTKRLHDGSPINAPYVHSFPLTSNYVVIPEYPLFFSGNGLPLILEGTIEAAFEWDASAKTYFHIISREKKQHIATIEADPAFAFHMGNAWEDQEGVHFECCVFPNGDIALQLHSFGNPMRKSQAEAQAATDANIKPKKIRGMNWPAVRQAGFGNLRRYTIPFDVITRGSGKASYRDIVPNVEFPRFNAKYTGKPSRYVWGCSLEASTNEKNETYSIVKVDSTTGEIVRYHHPGYACSEPIFVPKPGASQEDDGVIVTLVNEFHESDEDLDRGYVVILDGQTLQEFGKAEVGGFTPVTFHGSFVDKDFQDVSIN
jgi:torulene dioxygenase